MHRRYDTSPAAPDGAALRAWLESAAVLRADGAVLSWANPDHPGYPYPEAAALWLARACWAAGRGEAPDGAMVRAVRDRLAADLRTGGGAGRDGRAYLFDTALAIHALAWVRQAFPTLPPGDDADPAAWHGAVARFLEADAPVLENGDSDHFSRDVPGRESRDSHHYSPPFYPYSLHFSADCDPQDTSSGSDANGHEPRVPTDTGGRTEGSCGRLHRSVVVSKPYARNNGDCPRIAEATEARWSERWAPHLLRAAAFLVATARRTGDGAWAGLADEVRRRALREAPSDYGHARAYAAEGEALWRALGGDPGEPDPAAEALALAARQRADGGLPAFADGSGPARADLTAQAVRLWLLADPARHRAAADRALAFLAGLQSPCGGIAYEPGSGDANTWATVFADQARAWARDGADPRELL